MSDDSAEHEWDPVPQRADKIPADPEAEELADRIGAQAQRRMKARETKKHSIYFGLGTFGVVGWSVAIPALLGIAGGVWLDRRFPGQISWTLTGLFAGIVVGLLVAWNWVKQESRPD